ncbi:CCAAT/enhancer-binding protein zeta [Seminavis robusta]|uniref:CCAAT/enhancer-binding protein zeta n=1 Tax=Seminavis robusta TaxID=568900 RepID=A0A9N8DVT8_9STRA|nr:CCAAT/enhancer-binding protein zeta [Seminavis robusta]|eukprot:Sro381_g130900.1 CCAAT/enhancer-binding protein zeta (777) ;mRNA; f:61484-63887
MREKRSSKRREGTVKSSKGSKKPRTSSQTDGSYKQQNTLLISLPEDVETWFQYESSLRSSNPGPESGKQLKPPTEEQLSSFRRVADDIYRREIQLYVEGGNNKQEPWIDSTIRKGTLKDRIAAMSLSLSQNPVHSFHTIDGLLQMACGTQQAGGLPNSRVAQLAAEALEDLFAKTFLPPNRKLESLRERLPPFLVGSGQKQISDQNNLPNNLSPRLLLLWRFEEMVKEKFQMFLKNYLTKTLQEGLETSKISALRTASNLLRSVPEGEAMILSLLVNKLGDPNKKLAAAANNQLKTVLEEHPNMQVVIAREVQQLAHRPHLSQSALYNCITFLNQMKLEKASRENSERASLPANLITTYFKFFKIAIGSNKEEKTWGETGSKSRLLAALLSGVSRAQPYLSEKDKVIDEHIDELYRVVHHAPPTASTQALALLFQVTVGSSNASVQSKEHQASCDRYYRALYAALSGTGMVSAGRHSTIFFNILYKSLKHDKNQRRILAMTKRLLSTTMHCNPPSLAASIFVVNDVASHNPGMEAYFEDEPSTDGGKLVLQPTIRDPQSALSPRGTAGEEVSTSKPSSWELSLASHHYHPSASKFAGSAGSITYDGNPLQDFNMASFLDKFAYRNPKKVKEQKNGFSNAVVRFSRPFKDQKYVEQQTMGDEGLFFRKFFDEREKRTAEKPVKQKKLVSGLDNADIDYDEVFDQWESDPEEEAFYEMAAQKMLENTAGAGPVDVDDDDDFAGAYDWDSDDDDGGGGVDDEDKLNLEGGSDSDEDASE